MSERSIRRDHDRRRTRLRRRAQLAGASAAGASALLAGSAHADTFTVNSTADPGADAICDATECTLREAVVAANGGALADDIVFALPAGPQTISLSAGQLEITEDVTITGSGESNLTVDNVGPGSGYDEQSRVFSIQGDPLAGVSVDVSAMTLTGGVAGAPGTGPMSRRDGGAIISRNASLSLSDMTLTNNLATGRGGALSFDGTDANPSPPTDGSLSVQQVSITGNTAFAAAGGIDARNGSIEISESDFTGNAVRFNGNFSPKYLSAGGLNVNSADFTVNDVLIAQNVVEQGDKYIFDGSGGSGGGFLTGTGSISDSTVENNTAYSTAAGLRLDGSTAERTTVADNVLTDPGLGGGVTLSGGADLAGSTVTGHTAGTGGGVAVIAAGSRIDNSTITGNSAAVGAGAHVGTSASLTVRSSTIAGNTASTGAGGIFTELDEPPQLNVRNSIIADNQPAYSDIDSSASNAATVSFSLVESPEPGVIAGDPPASNLIGVDPQLSPLAGNGGPTETLLPALTSPAIDAAAASPLTTDQRGVGRPVDSAANNAPLSDGSDMGSVEVTDTAARGDDPETTITGGPSGTGNPASATFEFSSDDAGATFECSLDGAPFSACTNPATLSGLSDGPHSFEVRAKDADGNLDPTPAVRLFNVGTPTGPDTTAPATAITKAPVTLQTKGRTARATISFEGIDDVTAPGSLTFECRVDSGAFKPCTSPAKLKLKKGKRTIQVRAIDAAGNADATPAKVSVRVSKRKKAKG